jgi:hypothetical protein
VFASTTPRAVVVKYNAGSTFEDGVLENTKLGKVDVLVMPVLNGLESVRAGFTCWLVIMAEAAPLLSFNIGPSHLIKSAKPMFFSSAQPPATQRNRIMSHDAMGATGARWISRLVELPRLPAFPT